MRQSNSSAAHPARARRSLFKRYFLALFVAVLVPLLANGASEAVFGYRDQRAAISALVRSEAVAAANAIGNFLDDIVAHLGWTTHLPPDLTNPEQWRLDALRLLRQVPAITELAHLDAAGREQVRVSRVSIDVVDSNLDRLAEPVVAQALAEGMAYGEVYFLRGSEPYMTIALAGSRRRAGVSLAAVNLKLIWDVVSQIRVGVRGYAYVLDTQGQLVAHPDIALVLRGAEGVTAGALATPVDGAAVVENDDGSSVIAAAARVSGTGWTVIVEQPLSEAFAPIRAALWRTAALLLAGTALAAALAYFLARRMAGPIALLEEGARQIGAGNFTHRIAIATGDELERLADRFNHMASELAESQERSQRIARLKRFLPPQVAELVERTRRDAMLESQRVDVVAVFCDLRDFTAFAATAEPDAVMTLLAEYHQALGPIITRYEATQTNFSGDGMMMLLNAPLPCPDPAPRAVHMAMDMQAAVQALAVQWRSQGHAIGYGIGIAKGLSTVGSIGYEGRLEYTAIGSPVNLAARLCATAEDGEILTDAAVAEAVGPVVPLVNLGARPVKGFKEEIPTFSVAWRERAP